MDNLVTLIKLSTVHLYMNISKKIITFDVLSSDYNKDNFITVLEYFKNFWLLAKEQGVSYFLIIQISAIGIYPLGFYNSLIYNLNELDHIFENHMHSCYFLCKDDSLLMMLKPILNVYKFKRPLKICNTLEEIYVHFNKSENKLGI